MRAIRLLLSNQASSHPRKLGCQLPSQVVLRQLDLCSDDDVAAPAQPPNALGAISSVLWGIEHATELSDSFAVHDLAHPIFDGLEPLTHGKLNPFALLDLEVANFRFASSRAKCSFIPNTAKVLIDSLQTVESFFQQLAD